MTHAHACIAEPISYLRLERHALRELAAEEHARIDGHLAQCEACRACFEGLRGSEIALPALPVSATRARVTPLRRFAALGSALAAAAVVTLALRSVMVPAMTGPVQPRDRDAIKGGDVAIELIRERDGDIARDPSSYRSGDRFEVLLTCPAPRETHWDLLVIQEGEVFFPLAPAKALRCGNQVTLPGAFRLTGHGEAKVCAVLDERAPIDRNRLQAGDLKGFEERSACLSLSSK